MNAAITSAVGLVLVPGFAHRPVLLHEERDTVLGAVLGGNGDLRVHGGTRSPAGRLRVTAETAVHVEARPETVSQSLDLPKSILAIRKQLIFPILQTGYGTASARVSAPHPRIASDKGRSRHSRRTRRSSRSRRARQSGRVLRNRRTRQQSEQCTQHQQ